MQISKFNFEKLPDSENQFILEECLGTGVYGKVYAAIDAKKNNRKVAVKVQKYTDDTKKYIEQEYTILRDFSDHPNLIDFYGIFKNLTNVWLVLELCEGGPIIDLVNGVLNHNRTMSEEHIAYILKETIKALIYLHQNKIIHRNVKARNILLTREGDIKLIDFGLSHVLKSTLEKTGSSLGSPCWMAPEMINSQSGSYGNRADVWALGITSIELGDGKAPLQDMHPTRVLFQIVRNPPPTLYRPSNWSENYNDFINECLIKNEEHRPYMEELISHPFIEQIPDNSFHLSLELKSIANDVIQPEKSETQSDYVVIEKKLKKCVDLDMEEMLVEDLAALDYITERTVMETIQNRMKNNSFETFIGDVLLVLNPNETKSIYNEKFHKKYCEKSRSDNAPHIYAIADTAYQNAIHHVVPQIIVLTGECGSGKTKNYFHLVDHLLFLGKNNNVNSDRISNAIKLIHALIHASTPYNDNSTRCIFKSEVSYGATGKVTGAHFTVQCLEKWRVSSVEMNHGNFHIFHYIYNGIKESGKLKQYNLESEINYRYLRISKDSPLDSSDNISKFKEILTYLEEFEFVQGELETILNIFSAILILGNVRFQESEDNVATLENSENVKKVAELLEIDSKKFEWALTNYCIQRNRSYIRKKNTTDEARDSRDVLANNLYQRIIDYIIANINNKLSIGKAIFGEKYTVKLLDYFGFECFHENHLQQFFVNCLNEQIQYHYLQRQFSWEIMDIKAEEIEYKPFYYYNNKDTLDQLLHKSNGIITAIDQASKMGFKGKYIIDFIEKQAPNRICIKGNMEFSVAHFTGTVKYNVREMPDKNRDFLPPELIETLRLSENSIINSLFSFKLDKTGNLIVPRDESIIPQQRYTFHNNMEMRTREYSQIRRMRTSSTIFRSVCLELLRDLSDSTGTHFVRCIRTNLNGKPGVFHNEVIKQQVRALAVVETAKAKRRGYSYRISFSEFLRRYKFLAFDFNENVDITRENCRLLLIRLKMEGWAIGNTKVFLKYFNEEYLSRLYDTQVLKIIKIQSILRRFLVKCKLARKEKEEEKETMGNVARRMSHMTEEEAAAIIQQAYRKSKILEENLNEFELLDEEAIAFIKPFALKWKNKSLFQVLLQYRAAKLQDLFNFSQQVHLYNSNYYHYLNKINEEIDLEEIDVTAELSLWLGDTKPSVMKIFFHLNDIPFYNTSSLCDELTNPGISMEKDECWDTPYRNRELVLAVSKKENEVVFKTSANSEHLINLTFTRNPEDIIENSPESIEDKEGEDNEKEYMKHEDKGNEISKDIYKQINHEENDNIINSKNSANNIEEKNMQGQNLENIKKSDDFLKNEPNTKPANKDFDYIKAKPNQNKPKVDPITELKKFGRRSSNSSDDPPFNFQGMLRKTNFNREDSIKKQVLEGVRRFSLNKVEPIIINNNEIIIGPFESRKISEELVPGLFIEGYETEL